MQFFSGLAIPIKCFLSHRPPSREGGSVGRPKKKWNEYMKKIAIAGEGRAAKYEILVTWSFRSPVLRWYNRNRTIKCLKRLKKRSIDDNLKQLVLLRKIVCL